MRNSFRAFCLTTLFLFALPAIAATVVWMATDRPKNWRNANWASSGMLEPPDSVPEATIHVLAARTGGLKGALSVHSWLVLKPAGATDYTRYDKVGWGTPVRRNAFAADGRWYSNEPFKVIEIRGERAARLIPEIERAIAGYPYNRPGEYRIWPGPNSNSFVAHVLRQVPEIGTTLPAMAIGRDFPTDGNWLRFAFDKWQVGVNLFGLAGFAAGTESGLELQLLGLVAGIRLAPLELDLPGFAGSATSR